MDYTYKDKEKEYASYLLANTPTRIWWDFTLYIFEYGEQYYKLECESEVADSINKNDEAIIVRFTKHLEPFVPSKTSELVVEDKKIEKLYIVRGLLYFTSLREFSKLEQSIRKLKQKIYIFLRCRKNPLKEILSTTTGNYEAIICHPKSPAAINIDPSQSNLIDMGLLIQFEDKLLKAFSENKNYGFNVWNNKYFFDLQEIKVISEQYELIEV